MGEEQKSSTMNFDDISKLNQRKDTLKQKHIAYVEEHPELKSILSDFMSKVLLEKPKDIKLFAKRHFSQYLPEHGPLAPLIICGPSGVGKGTLIGKVMEEFKEKVGFSVSHTTRAPREGEEDGVHYHFTTREEIEAKIEADGFIEHADVHGNIYGTSYDAVKAVKESGRVCVLDIDVQGVKSVKETDLRARIVYIAPPSREELEARLRGRGTETEEAIQKRLANSFEEMKWLEAPGNVDKIIVNDDLEVAYEDLKTQLRDWYPCLTEISEVKEGKDYE